jgi:hypothetical protein
MKKAKGKVHEHNVLYTLIKRGGELDDELVELLNKNQKNFQHAFRIDITRINSIEDFQRYLSNLTKLERYFLGV